MLEDTRFMGRIDYVIYGKSPLFGGFASESCQKNTISGAVDSIVRIPNNSAVVFGDA